VLINNAGTAEPRVGAADLTADEAMRGFEINVFGPIRVTHAFLPLLRASDHPRIVNVSSGVGSFARLLTSGTVENAVTLPVYPATKAALTMLTVQYARALDGILVNAADPGFTGTDFNGNRGTQTVTEGTDAIVRLATLPKDGPTGTFQDRDGPVPWLPAAQCQECKEGAPTARGGSSAARPDRSTQLIPLTWVMTTSSAVQLRQRITMPIATS
jgi:NAD(P)-dependent dehydrogenase (short-subunit alcohol dehydrogenase family)